MKLLSIEFCGICSGPMLSIEDDQESLMELDSAVCVLCYAKSILLKLGAVSASRSAGRDQSAQSR
jgi:hypothetical protein